jgi:tetraprenyl-beta-curcumene synthase
MFPRGEDGGYLQGLVKDCREALRGNVAFARSREWALELTKLYIDLQSFKHLERETGEEKLAALYQRHRHRYPGLHWWEFAAACGSTLGVFVLTASPVDPEAVCRAYMPWVNGFHILLDYFIDQEEDARHGDMNLVSYHGKQEEQVRRLLWFYQRSRQAVRGLESPFHAMVVDGLLALYLSDAKARSPRLARATRSLLHSAYLRARVLERMARTLRNCGII